MKSLKIVATGKYLPKKKVENLELANILDVSEEFLISRTGIETRYYAENETIEDMAINAASDLTNKNDIDKNKIEMIIVATTTTKNLMPGISYKIQKYLNIKKCICLDILAGCAGYVNAFDIARLYITTGKCNNALIIGVDKLSDYTDKSDISTAVVLSDGAGATFIETSTEEKIYDSNILSDGTKGDILTCNFNEKIYMNGKEVYKYAVTETVNNIKVLLEKNNEKLDDIKYIIPHQANARILDAIVDRLSVTKEKMYRNISRVGNTFCASIPIAIDEMFENNLLKENDKVIIHGYGGGLNTASILMEV